MTTTTDFLTAQRRELLARRDAHVTDAEQATAASAEATRKAFAARADRSGQADTAPGVGAAEQQALDYLLGDGE